jgi:hypothetical protein
MLLHPAYHLMAAEIITDRLSDKFDVFVNDSDRRWADLMVTEGEIFTRFKSGFIRIFREPSKSGRLKIRVAIDKLSPETKKAIVAAIREARSEY